MLRIIGTLSSSDRKLLIQFSKWVMNKFVKPSVQRKSSITINFVDPSTLEAKDEDDLRKYSAALVYNGVINDRRSMTISIDQSVLNRKKAVKNVFKRLEYTMECIGHELVHAKQYLNNELFDYKVGDVRYRGQRYIDWEKGEAYYDSPWEIEAYGREQGLYSVFKEKYEKELKEKL